MTVKAFNLRGTNGSGKTFVARRLLELSKAKVSHWNESGRKPILYHGNLFGRIFAVLGSYQTACGGCDTIPRVQIVADWLTRLMDARADGVLFYEGLMISHMIGTVGNAVKPFGDRHVMGFLDTPLETCIERVVKRRVAAGNDKPFDPDRTLVKDYKAVAKAKVNAEEQGFQVVTINHQRALQQTLGWIKHIGGME